MQLLQTLQIILVTGLRDKLNTDTNDFEATYAGGNLVLTPGPTGTPGNSFIIGTEAPFGSSVI